MEKIKPIIYQPNPILREKSKPVPPKKIAEPEFANIISAMKATLEATPHGIGLAASQIGHPWRIFVIKIPDYTGTFINPEIVDIGKRITILEEGCLSVPRIYGPVKRPKTIKVKALDEKGIPFKVRAKGLLARVIQHELDHLEGALFIDKAEQTYKLEQPENVA